MFNNSDDGFEKLRERVRSLGKDTKSIDDAELEAERLTREAEARNELTTEDFTCPHCKGRGCFQCDYRGFFYAYIDEKDSGYEPESWRD